MSRTDSACNHVFRLLVRIECMPMLDVCSRFEVIRVAGHKRDRLENKLWKSLMAKETHKADTHREEPRNAMK